MLRFSFHKLVRDKLLRRLAQDGMVPVIASPLSHEAYQKALKDKLREEMEEVIQASSPAEQIEELADVVEVLQTLADLFGVSWTEVEEARKKKSQERGVFSAQCFVHFLNVPKDHPGSAYYRVRPLQYPLIEDDV